MVAATGRSVRRGGDDCFVREVKPIWTSSSFLIYKGALAGWSLLILAVLYAIAHAFRIRDRRIAAGIFAFASVIAWAVFIAFLFTWFGWTGVSGSFEHWSWARLAFWLLILAAAWDDRRRFG